MVGGVAEGELRPLRPLEVEVEVVLPREADAAMELDARGGYLAVRVGDVGLGHADGERPLGRALVHGPRRVVRDGLAVLDVHQHVGRLVLHALIRADGLTEGLPDLGVLHRHGEGPLGPAAHLRAERHAGALEHALEPLPAETRRANSASGPRVTSVRVTSQSFRVWSMVGRSFTSTPRAARGTRKRLTPSSPAPPPVRAATTMASA